jgi:hypothetical protein
MPKPNNLLMNESIFITYYGPIMFKKYLRWCHDNYAGVGRPPFMKVSFHKYLDVESRKSSKILQTTIDEIVVKETGKQCLEVRKQMREKTIVNRGNRKPPLIKYEQWRDMPVKVSEVITTELIHTNRFEVLRSEEEIEIFDIIFDHEDCHNIACNTDPIITPDPVITRESETQTDQSASWDQVLYFTPIPMNNVVESKDTKSTLESTIDELKTKTSLASYRSVKKQVDNYSKYWPKNSDNNGSMEYRTRYNLKIIEELGTMIEIEENIRKRINAEREEERMKDKIRLRDNMIHSIIRDMISVATKVEDSYIYYDYDDVFHVD